MNLRKTRDYKHVWINEDLGQSSKKMRNLIRIITKKTQAVGIDHRSGKYMLYLNREQYDGNNLDEQLPPPPPLHPSSVKQIQLDKDTIAYQLEHAPFSNLYPAVITMGECKFISIEQAYQYVKAKTMDKLLVATIIYLSRDQLDIKSMGDQLDTSDLWESCKYDVMCICMKRKFVQNPELKQLLLSSGNCELVEATPNRLWGCGATLSSNLLRGLYSYERT